MMKNKQLYFYPHLAARFVTLHEEVLALYEKDTENLKEHPAVILYLAIMDALEKLKNEDVREQYNIQVSLGHEFIQWKRIHKDLPAKYQLFCKYLVHDEHIFIAWLNNKDMLKKN